MMNYLLIFWIMGFLAFHGQIAEGRKPLSFRVGSLYFSEFSPVMELIKDSVNSNNKIMNGTRLDVDYKYSKNDPFDAHFKTCQGITFRDTLIYSSLTDEIDPAVSSVCSTLHIPHLTVHPMPYDSPKESSTYSLYLGPTRKDIVTSVVDFSLKMKWDRHTIAIITHKGTGSLDVRRAMEMFQNAGVSEQIQLLEIQSGDIRPNLAFLRNSGVTRFIVDIDYMLLKSFFNEAAKSGIVHSKTEFLCTTLDFVNAKVLDFHLSGAEIFGLSIVDGERLSKLLNDQVIGMDLYASLIKSSYSALIFDGIYLAGHSMDLIEEDTDLSPPTISCDDPEVPYDQGSYLLNNLKKTNFDGVTGRISLPNSYRRSIHIRLMKLGESGKIIEIGHWKRGPSREEEYVSDDHTRASIDHGALRKNDPHKRMKHVIVETLENTPFIYKKKDSESKNENDKYEGFLKDLIDLLAKDCNFGYTLSSRESAYGKLEKSTGNWTGIVGRLVQQKADIGLLADFTVSSSRRKVIDFSPPIRSSEISVMVKETAEIEEDDSYSSQALNLFSPFSLPMWLAVIASYFITAFILFIVGRLSPYERKSDGLLSLSNSYWFTLTGFFCKSTSVNPRAFSTRFLTASWWFFCFIIVLFYASSIYLQTREFDAPQKRSVRSFKDFTNLKGAKFGVIKHGSTHQLIQKSRDADHVTIRENIDSIPIKSFNEGVERVLHEPAYGFVFENNRDIRRSLHCGLRAVGSLGQRYHAIGFRKGFELKEKITERLLKYLENGEILRLKNKWFHHKKNHGECSSIEKSYSASKESGIHPLSFYSPFVLLFVAVVTTLCLAVIELLLYVFFSPEISKTRVLVKEVKNAIGCAKTLPESQEQLPNIDRYKYSTVGSPNGQSGILRQGGTNNGFLQEKLLNQYREDSSL